ncbi:D-ribose pyranase [Alicyclobacillaceae bacterium I2511]|nr:D-ribose pyranase [Alicyclobacillaceae bacterium I2511]
MKKEGILNPDLLKLLASVGHTDHLTITDRGFPIPLHLPRIDLSIVAGLPTVLDVLSAVHHEFGIYQMVVAEEVQEASPLRFEELRSLYPDIPIRTVPHIDFKEISKQGKGFIRTGDTCLYGNVIIVSG